MNTTTRKSQSSIKENLGTIAVGVYIAGLVVTPFASFFMSRSALDNFVPQWGQAEVRGVVKEIGGPRYYALFDDDNDGTYDRVLEMKFMPHRGGGGYLSFREYKRGDPCCFEARLEAALAHQRSTITGEFESR